MAMTPRAWGFCLAVVVASSAGAPLDGNEKPKASLSTLGSKVTLQSFGKGENPISKVCGLLTELSKEIEDNVEIEQKMFDKYGCWYETVMKAKKASNLEAKDRIEALNSYVDDVTSGRIEFSSEGADATKDVAELQDEIQKMDNRRKQEKEDYDAAHEEMTSSIAALEQAVEEMEKGDGSLLSTGSRPGLLRASELARDMLPAAKAALLARAASGEGEPKHGKKYKAQSGNIKELIKNMLETFKDNRAAAEEKEDDGKANYDKLREAKNTQKEQAQNTLSALGGETASRDEAASEAEAEIKALEDQVTADNDFMAAATTDHDKTKDDWKARKKLMTQEVSALSKGLAILRSDDARDAMSKAFDKDKVFNPQFIQLSNTSLYAERNLTKSNSTAKSVGLKKVIRKVEAAAADATGEKKAKLQNIAEQLRGQTKSMVSKGSKHTTKNAGRSLRLSKTKEPDENQFAGVVKMLNNAKRKMANESTWDKRRRIVCEEEIGQRTGEAQESSNFIDQKSRLINRTEFEVADLWAIVNKTVDEIAEIEWEANDAKLERTDFHDAFVQEEAGLEAAITVIGNAKEALSKFYTDNNLALMQFSEGLRETVVRALGRSSTDPKDMIVEAGEAPPPPPAVVTKEYEGNAGGGGIQSIMETVKEDLEADLTKLKSTEDQQETDYQDLKSRLYGLISEKMEYKEEKDGQIGNKMDDISGANTAKVGEKEVLDATVAALKNMEPNCDFVLCNQEIRQRNREIEAKSMNEAIEELGGDPEEVSHRAEEE